MFELKIGEEVINLKWGTYAMKRFSVLEGHPEDVNYIFDKVLPMFVTPEGEIAPVNVHRLFTLVEHFLQAGYEYANKGQTVDIITVDEWIDKLGGIVKLNDNQLNEYINYIMACTMSGVTPLPGDKFEQTDKKKDE